MPRTFPESPLCTLPVRKEITANRTGGRQRRADTPVALLAGLLVLYLSCEASAQALVIHDAWVRAMPPGQTMTAAYMQLENPGEQAVRVDGVEAFAATGAYRWPPWSSWMYLPVAPCPWSPADST